MLTLTKVVLSTSRSFEILSCRLFSSTPCLDRWHADKVANRPLRRFGFKDSVKMSGALPRISNDAPMIQTMRVFTPYNPWAPKRALGGQNDYIDILGADPDAIKPHEIHYHIPRFEIIFSSILFATEPSHQFNDSKLWYLEDSRLETQ